MSSPPVPLSLLKHFRQLFQHHLKHQFLHLHQGSRTLYSLSKLPQLKVRIVQEVGNVWVALANGFTPEGTKLVFLISERIHQAIYRTLFPMLPNIQSINSVKLTHVEDISLNSAFHVPPILDQLTFLKGTLRGSHLHQLVWEYLISVS